MEITTKSASNNIGALDRIGPTQDMDDLPETKPERFASGIFATGLWLLGLALLFPLCLWYGSLKRRQAAGSILRFF